jgi:hypothetical protein
MGGAVVDWWGKKGFAGAHGLGPCCSDIFWQAIERSSGQAEWFHREDDKEMSVRTWKFFNP